MQGLVEFVKTLGAPRIAAMGAVTIALIGFFAFLMLRVTAPQMTPLFTDLSLEDSATIVKELDREGVTYELRNDGNIIMVPSDRVARLRMTLAENGLPKGGGVGYEIFDKSDALGTTSFVQNINSLRALEGELAPHHPGARPRCRTPACIWSCRSGRCSRATRSSRRRRSYSRCAARSEPQQVRAIRHLVATAVSGLRPQRISIVDEPGQLLADGAGDDTTGSDVGADERQVVVRETAAPAGRSDRHLGRRPGPCARAGHRRFRLQPHHPDIGQIRSRRPRACAPARPARRPRHRTRAAAIRSRSATNCPARPSASRPRADAAPRDQSRKSEEIVNYEISKTTKTEVIEGGRVNRISVAVLVDGTYGKNDKGDVTYQPRSKEELDQIAALVRSAIGFDQKRGDQVEVVNLRFAETPAIRSASRPAGSPPSTSPKTTSCASSKWW